MHRKIAVLPLLKSTWTTVHRTLPKIMSGIIVKKMSCIIVKKMSGYEISSACRIFFIGGGGKGQHLMRYCKTLSG